MAGEGCGRAVAVTVDGRVTWGVCVDPAPHTDCLVTVRGRGIPVPGPLPPRGGFCLTDDANPGVG